jgi:hypothetical protein
LVQCCKFAKVLSRRDVVGESRILYLFVTAKANSFTVYLYRCSPFIRPRAPRDAAKTARVVAVPIRSVRSVLRRRRNSNIAATIIQRIAVSVVNSYSYRFVNDSHNLALHGDMVCTIAVLWIAPRSVNVEFLGRRFPSGVPVPLHEPLVIGSVNDGVLPESQRDKSDRLILRLDNLVAFHAVLHNPTSHEIVRQFSRTLNYTAEC